MKRPLAHQIDELATRVFRSFLPPTWTVNEHKHDYGKDYLIEIGVDDEMTGLSFFVQQKGKTKVPVHPKKQHVQFSLDRKDAEYYLDKVTDLPVFLIVIDVTNRHGWWIFLQPYLRRDQSWRAKSKAIIRISDANRLDDIAGFTAAVEDAKRAMKTMYAGSIRDAIEANKRRMEELDPRFHVSTTASDAGIEHELHAKETVNVAFTLRASSSQEIKQKTDDLFNKGLPVPFSAGDVTIEGSQLLEDVFRPGGVLRMSWTSDAHISLVSKNKLNQDLARIDGISGHITGGRSEMRFSGGLDSSPLTINLGPLNQSFAGKISLSFEFDNWNGRPFSQLPWFTPLYCFFATIDTATCCVVDFMKYGNVVASLKHSIGGLHVKALTRLMKAVNDAREIFKHFGIDPQWDAKNLNQEFVDDVTELHAVIFDGQYFSNTKRYELTAEVPTEKLEWLLSNSHEPLILECEHTYDIMGGVISRRLRRTMTDMSDVSTESSENPNMHRVTLRATEKTTLTVMMPAPTHHSGDQTVATGVLE